MNSAPPTSRTDARTKRRLQVFGPVHSRRLGRSLGVDLVPFKTCSYDCIYCQLGRTTRRTLERREWVPMDSVLGDLKRALSCSPDTITLGGSGEPTLHSRLGELIECIRSLTRTPVAVLTNGSLLWQEAVRAEVALADVVLPSLDAGDPEKFAFINRPHPDLHFDQVIEGLTAFRREFKGRYWLEVLLLNGYTAIEADVRKLAEWVRQIQPDRVQLNTVVRPPAEGFAMAMPREKLARFARLFAPPAEVIAGPQAPSGLAFGIPMTEAVISLLRRRPCTRDDVARGLGASRPGVLKLLEILCLRGEVGRFEHEGETFYHAGSRTTVPFDDITNNKNETAKRHGQGHTDSGIE